MLSNDTLLKFLQSCITEAAIVFKIECQNSFVTLYGRQTTYNNRIKCGPRGILNRSEPRNNMVYVSYDFYLINFVFIFIISHHSHMCPSPFFTEFSLPRHDRDGYRAFFNDCMISTKDIMNLGS